MADEVLRLSIIADNQQGDGKKALATESTAAGAAKGFKFKSRPNGSGFSHLPLFWRRVGWMQG